MTQEIIIITRENLAEPIEELQKQPPRKDMGWYGAFEMENFKEVQPL